MPFPEQVPHEWPHTGSGPHWRLVQSGVHDATMHWPAEHMVPLPQTPQLSPHFGSSPQVWWLQSGTHADGPPEPMPLGYELPLEVQAASSATNESGMRLRTGQDTNAQWESSPQNRFGRDRLTGWPT